MINPRVLGFTVAGACAAIFAVSAAAPVPTSPDDLTALGLPAGSHGRLTTQTPNGHKNGQGHARFGIASIDSLVNFNGHYFVDGFDSEGNPNNHWYFNTVGNPPQLGGTTTIAAPVVPVSLDLRNADGSPRFVNGQRLFYDATQFIDRMIASPVFQDSTFSSSSTPTQFTDAVQRAEYWDRAKADWHTRLAPSVKTPRVMTLLKGTYQFALNSDGSCCAFVLVDANTFVNELFPAVASDTTTPIGAAENAGEITTKDLSSFIFPNTFLFQGTTSNCCILGFHSYDFEPGDDANGNVEKRYVVDYASWISPGLFGDAFVDVTALSHEVAEIYNDPFVASDNIHDVTPWWRAPNGLCQNNLETGDVIEGLSDATYPIVMNGMTYHPQNEALLQWFEGVAPSTALDGAFSYPDTAVLTQPNTLQQPRCK